MAVCFLLMAGAWLHDSYLYSKIPSQNSCHLLWSSAQHCYSAMVPHCVPQNPNKGTITHLPVHLHSMESIRRTIWDFTENNARGGKRNEERQATNGFLWILLSFQLRGLPHHHSFLVCNLRILWSAEWANWHLKKAGHWEARKNISELSFLK